MRLRAVGIELLGGDVLREAPVERRPLRVRQPVPRRIASSRAASMRTARTGSSSSGARSSTRSAGSTLSRALTDARRTSGSPSFSPARTTSRAGGPGGGPRRRIALARAMAGWSPIAGDGLQELRRARSADRGRCERLGVALVPARGVPVPGLHLLGRPLGRPTGVASRTRVRHAELHREVRARDAEAVIVARVDHHVGGGRHVAADAVGAARARGWK